MKMLSKNVNNKQCAPKFVFFNEKKNQKYLDDVCHKKLTLKINDHKPPPSAEAMKFRGWTLLIVPHFNCHNK